MTIIDIHAQMTKWLKELIDETFLQRTQTTSQSKLTQYQESSVKYKDTKLVNFLFTDVQTCDLAIWV